jgi:hypothetical protein
MLIKPSRRKLLTGGAALAAYAALGTGPASAASSITASIAHGIGGYRTSASSTPSFDSTGGNWIGLTLYLGANSYPTLLTISDNYSNTYVQKAVFNDTNVGSYCYYLVCENATVGAGHVITFTPGDTAPSAWAYDVRGGVATSNSYDTSTSAFSTSATSLAVGPLTPTNDGSMLVSIMSQGAGGTMSISGGGFSSVQDDYTVRRPRAHQRARPAEAPTISTISSSRSNLRRIAAVAEGRWQTIPSAF